MFKFNQDTLDEAGFLAATFNDINQEDMPHVVQTLNDFLDGAGFFEKQVVEIEYDWCEGINVCCDDGSYVGAGSETTMQDIVSELTQ